MDLALLNNTIRIYIDDRTIMPLIWYKLDKRDCRKVPIIWISHSCDTCIFISLALAKTLTSSLAHECSCILAAGILRSPEFNLQRKTDVMFKTRQCVLKTNPLIVY